VNPVRGPVGIRSPLGKLLWFFLDADTTLRGDNAPLKFIEYLDPDVQFWLAQYIVGWSPAARRVLYNVYMQPFVATYEYADAMFGLMFYKHTDQLAKFFFWRGRQAGNGITVKTAIDAAPPHGALKYPKNPMPHTEIMEEILKTANAVTPIDIFTISYFENGVLEDMGERWKPSAWSLLYWWKYSKDRARDVETVPRDVAWTFPQERPQKMFARLVEQGKLRLEPDWMAKTLDMIAPLMSIMSMAPVNDLLTVDAYPKLYFVDARQLFASDTKDFVHRIEDAISVHLAGVPDALPRGVAASSSSSSAAAAAAAAPEPPRRAPMVDLTQDDPMASSSAPRRRTQVVDLTQDDDEEFEIMY